MNKKRREIIASNQISEIRTFSLGGYNQKVALDGKSKDAPLMLCLHGGPGFPIPFSVGCRGMFPEFTEYFIMVYWDQLGSGINDHPIDESFSIDSFTQMTTDLICVLKKEFPDNHLILFGSSWGSVLAANAASKLPNHVDGVLVYGQVLADLLFNEEVFEALLGANLSSKTRESVEALRHKPKHTPQDTRLITKLIRKHTEGYQNKAGEKLPLGAIIRGLLFSPDYSLKNFIALVKNGSMENKSIWEELLTIDLRDTLQEIRIPYRILQGNTDIVTPTKTISDFVGEGRNEHLSICVQPNSGHMPGLSGMDETMREAIELLDRITAKENQQVH